MSSTKKGVKSLRLYHQNQEHCSESLYEQARREGELQAYKDIFRKIRYSEIRAYPDTYLTKEDAKRLRQAQEREIDERNGWLTIQLTYADKFKPQDIIDEITNAYYKLKWIDEMVYYFERKENGMPHLHFYFHCSVEFSQNTCIRPFKKRFEPYVRDGLQDIHWQYWSGSQDAINYCDMKLSTQAWRNLQGIQNYYHIYRKNPKNLCKKSEI